ncbi:MAG TPA: DUF5131 family protein [Sedimentibacter sp.]|nr:DUF5131 family protein [Sedimentibacter sp.]HOG62001.1 DUF5131 family protein [Sedimentibacter sp.]HPB78721.1 DUF5131 family protein [Sedimentibacter sp.]HPY55503.1 DUF5131 family protein [Sedimentibacter sp.]HQC70136.1 DUF5131 family protein [Sedimentibacter sp.]
MHHVTVNDESGREARLCDYDWVLDIREQYKKYDITFWFKGTGSLFKHDGTIKKINPFKQGSHAKKFDINIKNSGDRA